MITRLSTTALISFASILVPFAASAASLTATQQGVVSASAPIGAQRATFLEVSFHAECDASVTVTSLAVRHRGLGETSDLERVYVTDGDTRLTHTQSLKSSGDATTLTFYPSLTVKACDTKKVQIRGDFSSEAEPAGQHGLIVDAIDAGTATVTLNALSKVSTITTVPEAVPEVTVELLGLTRTLRYGKTGTVARVLFHGDGYKDQEITAITLTNKGRASDMDLLNLRVRNRKGDVLSRTLDSLDGKHARIVFSKPLFLEHNTDLLVEMVADVRGSRSKTIAFVLEESSDLKANAVSR